MEIKNNVLKFKVNDINFKIQNVEMLKTILKFPASVNKIDFVEITRKGVNIKDHISIDIIEFVLFLRAEILDKAYDEITRGNFQFSFDEYLYDYFSGKKYKLDKKITEPNFTVMEFGGLNNRFLYLHEGENKRMFKLENEEYKEQKYEYRNLTNCSYSYIKIKNTYYIIDGNRKIINTFENTSAYRPNKISEQNEVMYVIMKYADNKMLFKINKGNCEEIHVDKKENATIIKDFVIKTFKGKNSIIVKNVEYPINTKLNYEKEYHITEDKTYTYLISNFSNNDKSVMDKDIIIMNKKTKEIKNYKVKFITTYKATMDTAVTACIGEKEVLLLQLNAEPVILNKDEGKSYLPYFNFMNFNNDILFYSETINKNQKYFVEIDLKNKKIIRESGYSNYVFMGKPIDDYDSAKHIMQTSIEELNKEFLIKMCGGEKK